MKAKGEKNQYIPVVDWPPQATKDKLGSVCGVSIDAYGNPVIFHRGERVWNSNTFHFNNVYAGDKNEPISMNTVLTLNSSGHVVNEWGAGKFFMPHMITVDRQNNVWITDVALHQVFKFAPYGGANHKPLIELGTPVSEHRIQRTPLIVAAINDRVRRYFCYKMNFVA